MKNNIKKDNILVRRNLALKIKKTGIKRINPEALSFLETVFQEFLYKLMKILKEEITIQGRKTLKKEDVQNAVKKIEKREEQWEI